MGYTRIGAFGCRGPKRRGRLGWPETVIVVVLVIAAVVLVALGEPMAGATILIANVALIAAHLIRQGPPAAPGTLPV
jgi:hypothetical protein